MSKRLLSKREELRKWLKQAEPNSALHKEIVNMQAIMEKPSGSTIPELIQLLKSATTHETKYLAAALLGSTKDPRVIKPLMRAAVAPENENYHSDFLWPLEKLDCTKHLTFFVNFMLSLDDPGEAMLACFYVIAAMKGPFEPRTAKSNIRKLLAAKPTQDEPSMQLQAEHFRMSAADHLMSQYFLQVAREYHHKPASTSGASKTP